MMKNVTPPGTVRFVKWLGYGGLIPFFAFAMLTWSDAEHTVRWHTDLTAYGATILSFVGALHWGIAMIDDKVDLRQRQRMFAWSVIPSLMAFVALALNSMLGDILLVCGFVVHYGMDLQSATRVALPEWYLPLRLRLSVVAVACLMAGIFAMRGS